MEILGYLSGVSPERMKPGLMFLLQLAWESRTRLPLLIMSGFMALGIRIQLEINIDHAVRFMPRLRLEEEDVPVSEEDDSSEWTSEGGYASEGEDYYYDEDEDYIEEDQFADYESSDSERDQETPELVSVEKPKVLLQS